MTTATTTSTQKNITKVKLFVLFVLVLVSSTGFAQASITNEVLAATTETEVSISKDATIVISTEYSVAASMDFAVWFMGSKKTSNKSTGSFSKKQLINSGINTNSVLIRSFLKKISTQENGVA
ncbi:hypothetical protein [Flavobacterium sp.]|uniref:hypothetical protein n=1 Tax=Flavobacterium sp. TaxID=239 RepID=UPI002488FC25|nr:hypothetical protein [Flavobacterium sp.]MDI1317783.1 hypothetical protein [Flavobacterium sp.]